jgi:putative sterol carrier protein
MSEIKPSKKKTPRGFAGEINNQLKPLNNSEFFKQTHGQDKFTLLLIATDDSHAALVKVENGTVEIEDIKNKPEEIKAVKFNGRISTTFETFLKFATGKINPIKAILTGQLKLKGIRTVLKFVTFFKILSHIAKEQKLKAENEPKEN